MTEEFLQKIYELRNAAKRLGPKSEIKTLTISRQTNEILKYYLWENRNTVLVTPINLNEIQQVDRIFDIKIEVSND